MPDAPILILHARGYAGCLKEGLHLLTHKFDLLWKFLWPPILAAAIVAPLFPPLLFLVAVWLLASLTTLMLKVVELGYVPSIRHFVLGRTMLRRLPRALAVTVVAALAGVTAYWTSRYVGVWISLTALLIIGIPLTLCALDVLFATRTVGRGLHHLGAFLAILIVTGFLAAAFCVVGCAPFALCLHVGEISTDGALPSYFPVLFGLSTALAALVGCLALLIVALPLTFFWGSQSLNLSPQQRTI